MYIIAVYDIKEERVVRVYKLFKQYLFWRQKSVFDGEIDLALLNELKRRLENVIKKEEDSVIFYQLKTKPNKIIQLGIKKIKEDENIILL